MLFPYDAKCIGEYDVVVATAIKLKNNISYRDVNTAELRNILRKNGAEIDL